MAGAALFVKPQLTRGQAPSPHIFIVIFFYPDRGRRGVCQHRTRETISPTRAKKRAQRICSRLAHAPITLGNSVREGDPLAKKQPRIAPTDRNGDGFCACVGLDGMSTLTARETRLLTKRATRTCRATWRTKERKCSTSIRHR